MGTGRRLGRTLLALMLVVGAAPFGALPGGGAPAPDAAYLVTMPPQRFFEVGPAIPLVENGQAQGFPEVFADRGGGIVVSYLEGFWSYYGSPAFARFNASTGAAAGGPYDIMSGVQWEMWSNTTARGAYAALDSQDRLVRVAWGFSTPNATVSVKAVDLAGVATLSQRSVGQTPYQRSAVAVALGANDTIHTMHYDTAGRYSVMAADGTWLLRNATVFNGTTTKFPPQLAYDAPAGRMVASWEVNGGGGGFVAAIEPNGSVAWSRWIDMSGANLSIAATQDGGVLAVFAEGGALYAIKFDRDGAVAAAQQAIVGAAPGGRTPRPVPLGDGEMMVVWSDATDGPDLDVRAMVLNSTDLSVTVAPTLISTDVNPSVNPRAAVDRDGGVWVVWQNDSSTYSASIWGARIVPRWTGYSMEAASDSVAAVRGEVTRVPVRLANLVTEPGEYDFTVSAFPLAGPSNWSGWVETSSGVAVQGTSLPSGSSADLVLTIAAPVADPAGYGAFVTLRATDLHRPTAPLSLTLNVTVAAGHRFEVGPADQSVTAQAGATAYVTFQVRNNGTVAQAAMPLALSAPPPDANWTATLQPQELTALPGEGVAVTLSVTPPALARSGESYCARLRVQHPNDPFSLATAGFCVRVALVADPQVLPESLSVEVDPGVAMQTSWTLTNVGNAGLGIVCSLAVQEFLPAGWSLTGSPAVTRLVGGASATLTLGITAPPQAPGATRLDLTLRASCEGSQTFHDLPLTVTVRSLHVVNYRTAGTTGDADSSGSATFTVNVENNGNVPEQIQATVEEAPEGWAATASLTQGGLPALQVEAFSTGLLRLDVHAPPEATAGAYRVVMAFSAGGQGVSAIAFTVRVPKSYGLSGQFSAAPGAVEAGGAVRIVGLIEHLGNAPDIYTVRIEVEGPQFWSSQLGYAPMSPLDASTLLGNSLTLDAFSRGALSINATAPREPLAGTVTLHVLLSNARGDAAQFAWAVQLQIADLQVSFADGQDFGEGSSLAPGAAVVRVVALNRGNLAAASVDVRLSLDGAPIAVQTIALLGPGESRELSFGLNFTAGDHRLAAEADPREGANVSRVHGKVYETDEGNNVASVTVSVGAPPPPAAPPKSLSTVAEASLVWVVAAAAAAGMVGFVVMRLRLRRNRR